MPSTGGIFQVPSSAGRTHPAPGRHPECPLRLGTICLADPLPAGCQYPGCSHARKQPGDSLIQPDRYSHDDSEPDRVLFIDRQLYAGSQLDAQFHSCPHFDRPRRTLADSKSDVLPDQDSRPDLVCAWYEHQHLDCQLHAFPFQDRHPDRQLLPACPCHTHPDGDNRD